MKFKAFIFEIIKLKSSNTKLITNTGFFLLIFGLIIFFLNLKIVPLYKSDFFSSSFGFIGILLLFFARFYQFTDYEKVETKKNGFIEFTNTGVTLNYNESINYKDITQFKLLINGYYGESINMMLGASFPTEQKSCGILNKIKISYGQEHKEFNFKLESESHNKVLQNSLFEIVIEDKLRNINAKDSLNLIAERFKKTESYKEYLIKLLMEKRINCTDGLLMIGYKNYEEAQILKEKYCG